VIEGDFQASNWLDLQRLHHNRREDMTAADIVAEMTHGEAKKAAA
jgi:hypothetical protein